MSFELSFFLYLLAGCGAGLMSGLLGLGGGVIVVPMLTFIFLHSSINPDIVIHLAIGTSLTAMIFTTLSATIAHNKLKRVEWNVLKKFAPGIILGVITGVLLSNSFDKKRLTIIFGIYLIFIATQMLFKKDPPLNSPTKPKLVKENTFTFSIGGIFIGLISGILGVGGGTLIIPFLTYFGRDMHKAIGTSAALGFFITIFGTIIFILLSSGNSNLPKGAIGFIYLPAVLGVSITSILFAPIGSKISVKLSPKILKRCFAILLYLISLKLLT
ncbi:sulfite exporter TauE/SafE family protein [Silvanigrella aquatica]|uniref:Probable membrane transporter protein n=1 Tax=Silvanigrella aquatica TaxID=1915309 RepID=A0A1L4D3A2_9BACT|nr:sulfite exporter TauE/SafE family protein [Silvanigrella aquatica]APJ04686.1 hypothetical protein AXG55_12545 [Silvanigrella aquatica]